MGNAVSENPNLIAGKSDNVIIYPTVYFTLISIQNQASNLNDSSNSSDSSEQVPINNETILPENSSGAGINSSTQEEAVIDNSTVSEETNSSADIPNESPDTEETLPESSPADENSTGGDIVSEVLSNAADFFLGILKSTGMTFFETTVETKIDAQASKDEPFIYQLKDGENIELLSGSVKTDSNSLPDSVIKITYQDNLVLASTDYSEPAKSEEADKNFTLNISKEISIPVLTDEEKNILSEKFGNFSIETAKSELFNGRYVLVYKLRDFTIEHSYDLSLDNETLKSQIESDKIKWLKDISARLNEEEPAHNPVSLA